MSNITTKRVKITKKSIETELYSYKDKPYQCLFEYIWNSFDAGANIVEIKYNLPKQGIGYVENLEIIDNGKGWNLKDNPNTSTFLASTKSKDSSKNKTLPRGKLGRGRYVFIWVADRIEIYSGKDKISLNHDAVYEISNEKKETLGTKINFINLNESFDKAIKNTKELKKQILLEFGWFMKQNDSISIKINGENLNLNENIKERESLAKIDFSAEIREQLDDQFCVEIILWENKPSEWSNFYFLDKKRKEIFKSSTGLNKKSDNFWHSVYIISEIFSDGDVESEDDLKKQLELGDRKTKILKNKIKIEIKEKLINLRKPYLKKKSEQLIKDLEEEKLLPNLSTYGIYDKQSYDELLKTVYVISPSLFTGKCDSEIKFICATFAGLLSSQDKHLIQILLSQLQELSEEEKADLSNILERTTLSNVVRTIKEIDNRLEVIDKLKILIYSHKKDTLEVKHIQKILDSNFWIFGEQFRLFSSTEGPLKKVLVEYARSILGIEYPELDIDPSGEVDLFLTKTEEYNGIQKNIVVELKRASVKLKEEKEYAQIKNYYNNIIQQSLCNGDNQYWEFYLIGCEYDTRIEGLIVNAQNHGEKNHGLVHCEKDGRVKIYVRKWSDILEVEWGNKLKYLKEKLEIKAKPIDIDSSDNIVDNLLNTD